VRQPAAAIASPVLPGKSGSGLLHSKTLARQPINPIQLVGHSFIEIALNAASYFNIASSVGFIASAQI
jgi:hypothetical protein